MSGPCWRAGGLRTLAAKVLDHYSHTDTFLDHSLDRGFLVRGWGDFWVYFLSLSLSDWELGCTG